jgi:hypothetical protein
VFFPALAAHMLRWKQPADLAAAIESALEFTGRWMETESKRITESENRDSGPEVSLFIKSPAKRESDRKSSDWGAIQRDWEQASQECGIMMANILILICGGR